MSRFEMVGGYTVNVDRIKKMWRDELRTRLYVELDDGMTLDVKDERCMYEQVLEGHEHVVQVIPVTYPLYATYEGDEKGNIQRPIRYMGLCADGEVRPLDTYSGGLCFADEVDDFIGICEGEPYKQTKREVAALEGILDKLADMAVSLDSIDGNLDRCMALTGRANEYVFRIAGDVFTN